MMALNWYSWNVCGFGDLILIIYLNQLWYDMKRFVIAWELPWYFLHPRVGMGSISAVRKLTYAYHFFFPVLDRNQNPNPFVFSPRNRAWWKVIGFNKSTTQWY